jgi:peptidoglycan/LPS O-acetylase OafA/YrhL
MKLKHLNELDGVRAIAALMVMFFHFFDQQYSQNIIVKAIKTVSVFGQTGVSLFFVLSGFLITRILLQSKNKKNFFKSFYLRRALRIFPLYYLFLVIYYFIVPLLLKVPIAPFQEQYYYWIYIQNIAISFNWNVKGAIHLWSLAVEEHFYIVWPFLIYFLNEKKIMISVYIIVCIALGCRFWLVDTTYGAFYFTFCRMDELAMGAYLAVMESQNKLTQNNANKFLALFIITACTTIVLWVVTSGKALAIIQVSKFTLVAFCYFNFIGWILIAKPSNWIKQNLQLKFLSYTGKISYGLYVYHPTCFLLVFIFLKPASVAVSFIACFVFTFLLSMLSYHLFESKFLILKKKFEYSS